MKNKKLIRLTETDLHRIVKESVNKVLNEIGDTPKGQFMLGAAIGRKHKKDGYYAAVPMNDYAEKKRMDSYNPKDVEEDPNFQNDLDVGFNQGYLGYAMPDKFDLDPPYDVTDGLAKRAKEKWSKEDPYFHKSLWVDRKK